MGGLTKFTPSAFLLFMGLGFEVSGIENPDLAKIFWSLAVICLLIPAWPYIGRLRFQSPIVFKKNQDESLPPEEKNGIEFFVTIDELRTKHPLPETFKPGNEIHAYFLTGEGVFAEHSDYAKCIKRLLLPEPNEKNLDRLRGINKDIPYESQIMTYANKVRGHGRHLLRFHDNFLGVSLLFCNPEKPDGWVQIGLILPEAESAERQHFRIPRNYNETAFLSFYETFGKIWNSSDEKTVQEHFEDGYKGN